MEKWATPFGTEKYFKWIAIHPSKQRKFDDLTVSALGAGTYLGPADELTDKLYEQTLLKAGLGGINFFDTAINYRNQRSERVLGKVIKDLAAHGVFREQIVIATKGGYIPGDPTPFLETGLIEKKDIVDDCHCIKSAFLESQIATSTRNLGVAAIDLYYLHNPEVQLLHLGEEEFYRKLREVFTLFEQKVHEKKICRYGIATWDGFRMKKGGLQLAKVLQCAKEAGGEKHHFKAIQLPFNLVMLEAIKQKKLFQTAADNQVAILISAPLLQGQIKHMCRRVFEQLPSAKTPIVQALEFVLSTSPVCTAFCGMRSLDHLDENKKVLYQTNWPADDWAKATQVLGIA
jgi:aryl-alcohol dehydrogenase-like predicted oxidoreductase